MTFVKIALEEISDTTAEQIRYNALSHRLSKIDDDAFAKFMDEIEDAGDKTPIEVDHEAQMRQSTQG